MINVYGSTGFIGSKYCELTHKTLQIPRHENRPSVDASQIIYFISTTHNYNIFTDPKLDINTNLLKFIDVLEEWRNTAPLATFNFISSWFVYGKQTQLPVLETGICHPSGFYSITKHAAEQLLISYCNTYKLNYRILRLANIIGPNDKSYSSKKNAITYMLDNLIKNKEIQLYDDGVPLRDFMHVEDCVNAINYCIDYKNIKSQELCIQANIKYGENVRLHGPYENQIINISNSSPVAIKDIINYCADKYNLDKNLIKYIPTPQFHATVQTKDMWLDNKKLLGMGYTPKYSVWQAIDDVMLSLL